MAATNGAPAEREGAVPRGTGTTGPSLEQRGKVGHRPKLIVPALKRCLAAKWVRLAAQMQPDKPQKIIVAEAMDKFQLSRKDVYRGKSDLASESS